MVATLLFLEMVLLGVATTWLFELILKTNKKLRRKYYRHHEILFGYHVHHSTYGLILIIVSVILFLQNQHGSALMVFGIGMGNIMMHTISDGRFVFIEKQRK